MKGKNYLNYLLIAVLFLAMMGTAQAALIVNTVTDEFYVGSPYPVDSVKACQCGTRTEILEIKNIGDFKALFRVEMFSPIKELMSLSEDTFELAPGKEHKVFIYINAPCESSLNTFYIAKVSTNYGRSKEVYKNFVSEKCQNIKYASKVLDDKIYPGDTTTIQFDIQNTGEFTETYRIIPGSHNEFTKLSEESVEIQPGETEKIYMYINFPLSVHGQIKMPFTILAEKNMNKVSGEENFYIEKDYDFAMKTEELELIACEDVTTKTKIEFENLAETPNKYYLYLTGPRFVSLSQKSLELEGGEEGSVELIISPKQQEIGVYELTLDVGTEYGKVAKQKKIKLTVNDCFDSSVSLEGKTGTISEKACYGEKFYTLNIKNSGLREEVYDVMADSPGWVTVDEEYKYVRLKPSQQANIPIRIQFPATDAKQTAFMMVKQLGEPYQAHEIKLELESLSPRSCYNIELLQQKYSINYETKDMALLLQNTGLRGGTYKLELDDSESSFIYLNNTEMSFEPGEMKVIHVFPADYEQYKQGTYLNKLNLKITLVDEKTDISYDRQFWVVLKDKNFFAKAWAYLMNFNYSAIGFCGLVSLILFVILAAFVIAAICLKMKKNLKMKRIKADVMKRIRLLGAIITGLIIVCAAVLILIGATANGNFYEQPSNESSPSYHEWKQNMEYRLDVSQYFEDPDDDVLSYTASQPNHIQVRIDGKTAILTPETNWAGTEHIVFTASDDKEGKTDSDVMTLHVLKRMPVGIIGYWNAYCKQINLVLLILILVLALVILDVVEEKGYKYYNPRKNRK